MAHCTPLLIELPIGKHLQMLGEIGGYVYKKWNLRCKNIDIAETQQPGAEVTTETIETRVRLVDW